MINIAHNSTDINTKHVKKHGKCIRQLGYIHTDLRKPYPSICFTQYSQPEAIMASIEQSKKLLQVHDHHRKQSRIKETAVLNVETYFS